MLPSLASAATAVIVVSKCTVYPDSKSTFEDLKLSISDLPVLSYHYIQKGLFFPRPHIPSAPLLALLNSLSCALSLFPTLTGCLSTLPDGRIVTSCNDAGANFSHAIAPSLALPLLLPPTSSSDVPLPIKSLFPFDGILSYQGRSRPLVAFQVTKLDDGALFIDCILPITVHPAMAVGDAGEEAPPTRGNDDVLDGGELPALGAAAG